ncbi:MAG: hypothetical protein PF448_14420 [Bacteroidales bacterium]|jgi:hypothetical protein|nr:hypothetical protein [Bacteroidales bacterium]
MKLRQIVFFSLISLFLFSCTGIKSTGKTEKYVHLFYTDIGAVQYFVKPLDYESNDELEASVDFTFRDTVDSPQVRMMFSVYSEAALSGHSECAVGLNETSLIAAEKVYAEPIKNAYVYRYEAIIEYSDFVEMVRNQAGFIVKLGSLDSKFLPNKKTIKALPHVDKKTITMLETR